MDQGSVVVDLSAPTGGNCEPTVAGETITHEGVTVMGPTNLPAEVSHTASQLYANNLTSFFEAITDDGHLDIDLDDEVVDSTLLVHDGTVRNPHRDHADELADTEPADTVEAEGDDDDD
jgi:NAD(P) transhydrogenase subunit alpha